MPMFGELALDLVGDAAHPVAARHVQAREMGDDGIARFGIEFGEGQIFQFLAHILHADAAGQRRIDVNGFLGDAAALVRLVDEAKRSHIVQPVCQLHQQHADVAGDRQHQFAEILGLLGALGKKLKLGEFGDPVHQASDLFAEILLDVVIGDQRVFDRVVEQRRDDGGNVELQLGQDGRDFQGMGEIGIARGAELLAMGVHGIDIGLVEQGLVGLRGHRPSTRSTRSVWRISLRRPRDFPKAAATAAAITPRLAGAVGADGALMTLLYGNSGLFC